MSFKSPYPPVEISEDSVYETLFGSISEEDLDRTALIDAGATEGTTYRELIDRINAFAGALAARGVEVGDKVALLSPNTSAFAFVFHGILRAGATATTVNALFTAPEIAKQLTDSGAKMLITITQLGDQAKVAAAQVGLPESAVILLNGPGEAESPHPNALDLLGAGLAAPDVSFDPATHLAVLPYSSGTTGNPKGVMLTHRNLVANVAQSQPLMNVSHDDSVLAVLPFFHIYGLTVLLNLALYNRARLVVLPRFDLVQFLESIQNYKCSCVFIAPPVAVALAKHPLIDDYDLSSVNTVMSGAAPLDEVLGNAVAKRLNTRVVQGYGMSELSPVSHAMPSNPGDGPEAPLSSCGWPIPNTVNKIVDPATGDEIDIPAEGLSEPGELWVAGPNVMAGYLNNDKATKETIDDEGFLHTGDMARVDANGCVYIVDRLKELIKYKGYQVPPAELEALLLTHDDVADVAVIGVIEADTGEEIPKAFVVKRPGAELTEQQVIDFVAGQVAPHKKVREVEFIDAIPKSSAGKILRKDLRQPA